MLRLPIIMVISLLALPLAASERAALQQLIDAAAEIGRASCRERVFITV